MDPAFFDDGEENENTGENGAPQEGYGLFEGEIGGENEASPNEGGDMFSAFGNGGAGSNSTAQQLTTRRGGRVFWRKREQRGRLPISNPPPLTPGRPRLRPEQRWIATERIPNDGAIRRCHDGKNPK